MQWLLTLALRFIDGFVWPWRLVTIFIWTVSMGGASMCLKWLWWFFSSPLRILTAAWREQQAQEKVSAMRAKIEAMAHTILDLETNLEVAQTERLRMRDRLNTALADRQRFYERAVKALAKAKRLKVELEERYEAEGSEFGTDHEASQSPTPGKMNSDVKLLKDQIPSVPVEAAAEAGTPQATMSTVTTETDKVAAPSDEPNLDDLKETDDEEVKTMKSYGPKGGRIYYVDPTARTAGTWLSTLCSVLAAIGVWATSKSEKASQVKSTMPSSGFFVVAVSGVIALLLFMKKGTQHVKRVSRAHKEANMFLAMGFLSLDWLALGFMACATATCVFGPTSIHDRICRQ